MSSKKRFQDLTTGFEELVKETSSNDLDKSKDAKLHEFIKTGTVKPEAMPAIMRSYRIPNDLLQLMEEERFEASKRGERINFNDMVVDSLRKRYSAQ